METGDAFGRMLLDAFESPGELHEIVERDDGFVGVGRLGYFDPVRRWPAAERRALRHVRGRVLDVGCGAGRVALELQRRAHEVVAIDLSPGAVEVAGRRGVRDARLLAFERVDTSLGRFGTVVLFGNNFGLFGSESRAGRLLRRLARLTDRIVASTTNPYATDDPAHHAYHELNRRRGRMAGQVRIRVRYRNLASPWFDYLLASRDEVASLAATAGWRLRRSIEADGPTYVVVLELASASAG